VKRSIPDLQTVFMPFRKADEALEKHRQREGNGSAWSVMGASSHEI